MNQSKNSYESLQLFKEMFKKLLVELIDNNLDKHYQQIRLQAIIQTILVIISWPCIDLADKHRQDLSLASTEKEVEAILFRIKAEMMADK